MTADRATGQERKKRQSGATLIEFCFAIVPTLGFIFLFINLAWVIFAWACVQEAVREGVRSAITCTPTTGLNAQIESVIKTYSFGFINASNICSSSVSQPCTTISIQYLDPTTLNPVSGTGSITTGDVVKVTISGLKIGIFAPVDIKGTSPLYVSAVSADMMACSVAATP